MTNEELRLAIAKAKGYKETYTSKHFGLSGWIVSEGSPSNNIPNEYIRAAIPNWPTSIADAWELVDVMGDVTLHRHLCGNSADHPYLANGGRWYVTVYDGKLTTYTEADTAPRAICEAWLEWKAEK